MNQIPEIYCSIAIFFEKKHDINFIVDSMKQLEISEMKIHEPKFDHSICVEIATIKNEPFWNLDDALTKMFLKIDGKMAELKKIVKKYDGDVCIDIAFYQYGTYPVLVFSAETMKKIHYLDAVISIDPY
jgi:hypothetical protein